MYAYYPWHGTGYRKWLTINDINGFWSDFDPQYNVRFIVRLPGWVNEPCPAQWVFGSLLGSHENHNKKAGVV